MSNKSFWIPVGWNNNRPPAGQDKVLSLNSNTLVLDVGREIIQPPFDIERVPGSWSPHVPEKKPRYRITLAERDRWRAHAINAEPQRLQTVGVGRDILVVLPTSRPQRCLNYKNQLHGIYYNRTGIAPWTYCGLSPHMDMRHADSFVQHEHPTCKACLFYKSVWSLFTIWPYDHKEVVNKRLRKEKSDEEKRLRLPTAYARILDDDLFENPTYKPPRSRPGPPPDHDPLDEDYVDPRDRKRASEIDRTRRLEESKALVQGHRRR